MTLGKVNNVDVVANRSAIVGSIIYSGKLLSFGAA